MHITAILHGRDLETGNDFDAMRRGRGPRIGTSKNGVVVSNSDDTGACRSGLRYQLTWREVAV
jgi:hypothetical protein